MSLSKDHHIVVNNVILEAKAHSGDWGNCIAPTLLQILQDFRQYVQFWKPPFSPQDLLIAITGKIRKTGAEREVLWSQLLTYMGGALGFAAVMEPGMKAFKQAHATYVENLLFTGEGIA